MLVRFYLSSKVFLEDMEDIATELHKLDAPKLLQRLRATRTLADEGVRFGAICVAEARRQAA